MKGLRIAGMLRAQRRGRHISFHTPGHKKRGDDITELSYSDCLYAPQGVLLAAERDIAAILGASKSFILTDGSTSGVFSMLAAAKEAGAASVAVPVFSHPSVWHACRVMGIKIVPIPQFVCYGIPKQPDISALSRGLEAADALLLTSPDYYGFLAPLEAARTLSDAQGKLLLVDGAHGSHLHFEKSVYAGTYADLWVDGVHKSLPALTQGAVVSAQAGCAEFLEDCVRLFRTTSPSYPIMASVEAAVKYPQNKKIEAAARACRAACGAVENDDWTKLVVPFGGMAKKAAELLEKKGVYPEFCDENYLMFYFSPCTKAGELKKLCKLLAKIPREEVKEDAPAGVIPMYREEA